MRPCSREFRVLSWSRMQSAHGDRSTFGPPRVPSCPVLPGRALSVQGVPPPLPKGGTPCPDSAAPRGARVLLARPADRAKTVLGMLVWS